MDKYNGILPVYKDAGMTSHDVIYRLRRIIGQQKIGHTGTLDPQASGVLVICLGRATKLTQFLTDWDKRYEAEIKLGYTSDTLDADGTIEKGGEVPELSEEKLASILDRFTGRITQQVPAYSAVKVDGRELYKYARKGQNVEAPTREVEITALEMKSFDGKHMTIVVGCSKGTYIRTLAHDIGREIGCGGYVTRLERLAAGPFTAAASLSLDEISRRHTAGTLEETVLPMRQVIDFPVINLRNRAVDTIMQGGLPAPADVIDWHGEFGRGDLICMADEGGDILAIGKSTCDAASYREHRNRNFFSYVRVLT